jgi:hypothetical protein
MSPIFRTHGDRKAPRMAALPAVGKRFGEDGAYCTAPGGHAAGGPNELWEFGDEVAPLLVKMIQLRESLRPYIKQLAASTTATGAPPTRPLFYDFPDDTQAWTVDDEYMFGRVSGRAGPGDGRAETQRLLPGWRRGGVEAPLHGRGAQGREHGGRAGAAGRVPAVYARVTTELGKEANVCQGSFPCLCSHLVAGRQFWQFFIGKKRKILYYR